MDQPLSPSASHVSAVRDAIFGEFFWLLGLPEASPWRHRLMPLLQPVVGRFADLAAEFDQAVAQVGLASAIRPYYSRFAERVIVTGMETLPATGPLLVVSNHPGAYDLFLILASLPRDDVKVIVSEISILHRLPAFDRYFISIGPSASSSVPAAKAGVRHLQDGGALFLFPGGIVDPDPAFMPGAVESLERWSPSLELFLRRVPETQVVVAIVSGVLSRGWFDSPVTRLRQERKDRQKIAEACQVAQQMLWPRSIRILPFVTFDRPFAVSELSQDSSTGSWLAAIRERARLLLALRGAVLT